MMQDLAESRGSPRGLDTVLEAGWSALARFDLRPAAQGDAGDFFACAGRAGAVLHAAGLDQAADAITAHAAYLAGKRQLADAALLCGMQQPDDPLTRDAIWNIAGVLQDAPTPIPPQTADQEAAQDLDSDAQQAGVPARVLALIKAAERELQGWCGRDKALAMARLVLQEKPTICVEIGIFGGRSLVPCAAALQSNGAGRIYGIEAWDAAEAVRNATGDTNDDWWRKVDFAAIKRAFFRFVVEHDLTAQVCVLETSSRYAAASFEAIDFLHIDGSHAVIGAAEDVLLYATKVRPGGIVVFDDTDWITTVPAQTMLAALGTPLMTPEQVRAGNYAVFRRYAAGTARTG